MLIQHTDIGIALTTQLDLGDVFQLQHLAISGTTDHDLAELLRQDATAPKLHGVLIGLIGVLTERAGRRLDVLLSQHGTHVRRHQAILRHDVRLQPDTHRIVTTEHHHLAHTLETQDLRLQVDTDIVGQEALVEAIVGT